MKNRIDEIVAEFEETFVTNTFGFPKAQDLSDWLKQKLTTLEAEVRAEEREKIIKDLLSAEEELTNGLRTVFSIQEFVYRLREWGQLLQPQTKEGEQ